MAEVIRHVIITGRVQGIGYRVWTIDEARSRGLLGWVRNRKDDSVEAVFEGPREIVDQMIVRCRVGPSMARVADVTVREATQDELALRGTEGFAGLPTV